MKSIAIVALALVAIAAAIPVEEIPTIVSQNLEQQPDGSYKSSYETSNGIRLQEEGILKEVKDEDNKPKYVLVVRGQYSYPRLEGGVETISYGADENGYAAEGESVPKNPPAQA